ncbi:MAG: hypothetical protein HRT69_03095 [Flavobacteriaceae bacterium]|nr:hypothetical protein [Flavobacteriaceae bacterium]
MKKILLSILFMLFVFGCFSQTFNYQAAARDNSGSLLQNQNLGVQVSILFGGSAGANLYSESHNVTTNAYGILDLPIGGGSVISGDFNAIDWSLNSYWVEISMDVFGGASYTLVGASQLRYVPFAMYAASGAEGPQGPDGSDGSDGAIGVGITSTVDNGNGTFTLNYSDGTNFTTSDLTGPAGVDGEAIGIGPAGADGVDGTNGLDGRDGVGITSTVDNGNGTFTLNYSDTTSFTTIDLRGVGGTDGEIGPDGADGSDGADGAIGAAGADGINGTNGIDGATGPAGTDGTNGIDGAVGTDGVGITSTVDNGNGTFTLNYSDATTFTTADLTGPQGAQGDPATNIDTNLSQNTTTGVITYVNESAASQTANVVSADANNMISVGTSGGAYLESSIAEVYDMIGGQALTTTFGNINFATQGIVDGNYSVSTNSITVTSTGRYRITYRVTSTVTNNARSGIEFQLTNNNSVVPGTHSSVYQRNNDVNRSTATVIKIMELSANNVIRVQGRRYSNNGNIQTYANGSSLVVEKIN